MAQKRAATLGSYSWLVLVKRWESAFGLRPISLGRSHLGRLSSAPGWVQAIEAITDADAHAVRLGEQLLQRSAAREVRPDFALVLLLVLAGLLPRNIRRCRAPLGTIKWHKRKVLKSIEKKEVCIGCRCQI
jgi:hypothetical protein